MGPQTTNQRLHAAQAAIREWAIEVGVIAMSSELDEAGRKACEGVVGALFNIANHIDPIIQSEMHATSAKLEAVFASDRPTVIRQRKHD
jgi:hypothetical protein